MAKTDAHIAKPVNLEFITPVLMTDGSGVGLTKNKKGANVIFFQVRSETATNINADVIAAVRLDITQMESLQKGLEQALTDIKAA